MYFNGRRKYPVTAKVKKSNVKPRKRLTLRQKFKPNSFRKIPGQPFRGSQLLTNLAKVVGQSARRAQNAGRRKAGVVSKGFSTFGKLRAVKSGGLRRRFRKQPVISSYNAEPDKSSGGNLGKESDYKLNSVVDAEETSTVTLFQQNNARLSDYIVDANNKLTQNVNYDVFQTEFNGPTQAQIFKKDKDLISQPAQIQVLNVQMKMSGVNISVQGMNLPVSGCVLEIFNGFAVTNVNSNYWLQKLFAARSVSDGKHIIQNCPLSAMMTLFQTIPVYSFNDEYNTAYVYVTDIYGICLKDNADYSFAGSISAVLSKLNTEMIKLVYKAYYTAILNCLKYVPVAIFYSKENSHESVQLWTATDLPATLAEFTKMANIAWGLFSSGKSFSETGVAAKLTDECISHFKYFNSITANMSPMSAISFARFVHELARFSSLLTTDKVVHTNSNFFSIYMQNYLSATSKVLTNYYVGLRECEQNGTVQITPFIPTMDRSFSKTIYSKNTGNFTLLCAFEKLSIEFSATIGIVAPELRGFIKRIKREPAMQKSINESFVLFCRKILNKQLKLNFY